MSLLRQKVVFAKKNPYVLLHGAYAGPYMPTFCVNLWEE